MSRPEKADATPPAGDEAAAPDEVAGAADLAAPAEGFAPGDALAAARDAVLARRAALEAELPPPPPALARGWLAAALVSWGVVVVTFLAPPALMRPPVAEPYAPPPGMAEASYRYGLWLADGAVRRFVAREGRLPSFPAEAGILDPAIALDVTGEGSWRLSAPGDLVLASDMAAEAFLGESVAALRSATSTITSSPAR